MHLPELEAPLFTNYTVVSIINNVHPDRCVLHVRDTRTDADLALKIIDFNGPDPISARSQFEKEIAALEGLDHPAVVQLRESFVDLETNFGVIVLDFIHGGQSLQQHLSEGQADPRERKPIPWRLEQLLSLLEALEAAHERRVVHRDIKPSNILVDRDHWVLKLSDFGIAKLLNRFGAGRSQTLLGRQMFSLPYASPEQRMLKHATYPTDFYSFGVLIVALLTYELPGDEFAQSHVAEALAVLSGQFGEELTGALIELVEGLLHEDPTVRPAPDRVRSTLKALLDRVIVRQETFLRKTQPIDNLVPNEFASVSAVLRDLNDGLRARYERDLNNTRNKFIVHLYGKRVYLRASQSEDNNDQLTIKFATVYPESKHYRERERGRPQPFEISFATGGDAYAFQNHLYDEYNFEQQRKARQTKREKLVKASRILLEHKEIQLVDVSLRLRVRGGATPEGAPLNEDRSKQYAVNVGDAVDFEVLGLGAPRALPTSASALPEGVLADWAVKLNADVSYALQGKQFGEHLTCDPSGTLVTVRITRARTIPKEVTLTCTNMGLKRSLERERDALNRFEQDNAVNKRLGTLVMAPESNSLRRPDSVKLVNEQLEPTNEIADLVADAVACNDFFLIKGPPGTGKTEIIKEVLAHILSTRPEARILLTAQANEAVDNALERLQTTIEQHRKPWRLWREARRPTADVEAKGTQVFQRWVEATVQRSVNAEAEHEVGWTQASRVRKKAILHDWRSRLGAVDDAQDDYLRSVQVFGSTLLRMPALLQKSALRDLEFDYVIIDEAAKATHSELLVALTMGRRFILVGDHKQLPPTIHQEVWAKIRDAGIDLELAKRTFFQHLFEGVPQGNRRRLKRQYRMHPSIGTLVGDLYYGDEGGLESGVTDENRPLPFAKFRRPHRVFWLDTVGVEARDENSTSWYNLQEAKIIRLTLTSLRDEARREGVEGLRVAIISPYTKQIELLQREIVPGSTGQWAPLKVGLHTVDSIQGREVDVVLLSTVRTSEGDKRFVGDAQRLNVALSRARLLVLIFGDLEACRTDPELERLIQAIPRLNHVVRTGGAQ